MEDYSTKSTSWLKCELAELAENGITKGIEVEKIKAVLNRRYPIE